MLLISNYKKIIKILLSVPINISLYIINIYKPVKLVYFRTNRLGHLALNTEFFLRKFQVENSMKNYTYILIPDHFISNRVLYNMYKNYFKKMDCVILIKNYFLVWILTIVRKVSNKKYYFDIEMKSNEYELFTNTKPTISFNEIDIDRGNKILKEMGIDSWYICIFARDTSYLEEINRNIDWTYHDYRNADINSFELAVNYIIDKGGYVVRLGNIVKDKINFKHKQLIDYPFTNYVSDFMDIFLVSQCKFVLSTTSGATDTCSIFNIPRAGVNWMPIDHLPFTSKYDIGLVKKLKKDNKYISLEKYFIFIKNKNILPYDGNSYQKYNILIEDNSREEIFYVCREMFEKLNNSLNLSDDDIKNQKSYQDIHKKSLDFSMVKTLISYNFLKNNKWFIENNIEDI